LHQYLLGKLQHASAPEHLISSHNADGFAAFNPFLTAKQVSKKQAKIWIALPGSKEFPACTNLFQEIKTFRRSKNTLF
jgi:hypothetical protein